MDEEPIGYEPWTEEEIQAFTEDKSLRRRLLDYERRMEAKTPHVFLNHGETHYDLPPIPQLVVRES